MLTTDDAARGFDAVGAVPRVEVLQALVRAGPEGLVIGELQSRLGIPPSTLAHHLRVLSHAGLIRQERDGRRTICRPDFDVIEELAAFLTRECCADQRVPDPVGGGQDERDR